MSELTSIEYIERLKAIITTKDSELRDLQRRLDAAEKERDEWKTKFAMVIDDNRRVSAQRDELHFQLAQRRDMTLTAEEAIKELKSAVDAMESAWHELEPGFCVIGDQFIRQSDMRLRITQAQAAIRRWSREGKVEPPSTKPAIYDPQNDPEGAKLADAYVAPKPPAPDLAALRTRLLTALTDDAVRTLEAFIDAKLAAREEK